MTKILIDEAVRDAAYMEHRLQRAAKIEGEFNQRLKDAIRDGHSDTPGTARECLLASVREDFIDEKRLWDVAWESALRQALANEVLDKMAENERELGIQMQPTVPWSQELESVWAEPDDQPAQDEPISKLFGTLPVYDRPQAREPEQPAQEPDPDELTIAYMSGLHEGKKRKPWVGLTNDERKKLADVIRFNNIWYLEDMLRAAEEMLERKNT